MLFVFICVSFPVSKTMSAIFTMAINKFTMLVLLQITLVFQTVFAHSPHKNNVLLISFDGFRYDYIDMMKKHKIATPSFDQFIQHGVKADYMMNQFVTKTFPNHFSIATGLYEEAHGVVGNEFFDPVLKAVYNTSKSSKSMMFNNGSKTGGAEPIWITNQLQGKHSGCSMWPGCDAPLREGKLPFRRIPYKHKSPFKPQIDTMLNWYNDHLAPINLGLMYNEEPDHTGHNVGPDSPKILDVLKTIDGFVGYLLDQIEKKGLKQKLNVILTSDHGFANTSPKNTVVVSQHINMTWFAHYGHSPVWGILPKKGKEKAVLAKLKAIKNVDVYKKEELPASYHYRYNRRIMPIILSAKFGWSLAVRSQKESKGGNHGWTTDHPEMRPFFLAMGPAFKEGYKAKPFSNVDIFPLLAHILELRLPPINGSFDSIKHVLRAPQTGDFAVTTITFMVSVGFAALVAGVYSIAACRVYNTHRKHRMVSLPLSLVPDGKNHLLSDTEEDELP